MPWRAGHPDDVPGEHHQESSTGIALDLLDGNLEFLRTPSKLRVTGKRRVRLRDANWEMGVAQWVDVFHVFVSGPCQIDVLATVHLRGGGTDCVGDRVGNEFLFDAAVPRFDRAPVIGDRVPR